MTHVITISRVSLPGDVSKRWSVRCSCSWRDYATTKSDANDAATDHVADSNEA
jgi:hypothetical protein